jgi:hypothetical protein
MDTPQPFPLLIGLFRGARARAMIAIVDPRATTSQLAGEGHAPVVAVRVPAVKVRRVDSDPQRACIMDHRKAELVALVPKNGAPEVPSRSFPC